MSSRARECTSAGPTTQTISPAPRLFLAQQLGQHAVVHRLLARHLGLHEPELVGAVRAAQEPLGVHVDALAAVLRGAQGDRRAARHAARLGGHELAVRLAHDHAVHARQARTASRRRPPSRRSGDSWSRRTRRAARRRPARARTAPRAPAPAEAARIRRQLIMKGGASHCTDSRGRNSGESYPSGPAHSNATGSRSATMTAAARPCARQARITRPSARGSVRLDQHVPAPAAVQPRRSGTAPARAP